jgi:hypothetical protein
MSADPKKYAHSLDEEPLVTEYTVEHRGVIGEKFSR